MQSVKDLQATGKRWLEDILGQHLSDNQQVFIMVFTPGAVPSEAARREARSGLEQTWAQVGKHIKDHGVTDEQCDTAVDEAMEHVRQLHGLDDAGIDTYVRQLQAAAVRSRLLKPPTGSRTASPRMFGRRIS